MDFSKRRGIRVLSREGTQFSGATPSQPGHFLTENREPSRIEPNRTEISVFFVFGFGFGSFFL